MSVLYAISFSTQINFGRNFFQSFVFKTSKLSHSTSTESISTFVSIEKRSKISGSSNTSTSIISFSIHLCFNPSMVSGLKELKEDSVDIPKGRIPFFHIPILRFLSFVRFTLNASMSHGFASIFTPVQSYSSYIFLVLLKKSGSCDPISM